MWEKDQATVWDLAARQHGVVSYRQLRELGLSRRSIEHRIARGRLHRVRQGVYAIGRPQLTQRGCWMAAVLSCGEDAVLSHSSAAALWGIGAAAGKIEITACSGAGRRQPDLVAHRRTLDRRTFRLTRSELERRFLPLVAQAGLPTPQTRQWVNGFEVDFFWPGLGLVVETDGLRYHRTPAQQARDRLRDQTHTSAGLTPLRFTHAQVRFEAGHVRETLRAVARRLGEAHGPKLAGR